MFTVGHAIVGNVETEFAQRPRKKTIAASYAG